MISENSIFVLGAGASEPYGYPCGRELCRRICVNLENELKARSSYFLKYGFSKENIIEFRNTLGRNMGLSIDIFLQNNRKKFMEIGKFAIAQELIRYEDEDKLFAFEEKNWYLHLSDYLIQNCESHNAFQRNRIAFITFNYDRSLEHYLFRGLEKQYEDANDEDIARIVNQIPILHIYGRLDYLPWQRGAKDGGRDYSSAILDEKELRKSVGELNIVCEGIREKRNNDVIERLFADAKFIYFIGFAYDMQNLHRLNIPSAKKRGLHSIYGSAYKIGLAKRHTIEKYFMERLTSPITLGSSEEDAIKFFERVLG